MINFQKMMQQAQDMQMKLQELNEKMKDVQVEAESGGGMVKVIMSCDGKIVNITIDPSVISGDKETLEDLIIAAINNGTTAKDQKVHEETQDMLKDLGLPEGTQLPNV